MIFYLHIPKTAGQTLAVRLASAFPTDQVRILKAELQHPEGTAILTALRDTHRFVESHVTGPVLEGLDDIRIMTTVREPVARLISAYRHIRREPRDPLSRPAHRLTPAEFFAIHSDILANHQARYIIHALYPYPLRVKAKGDYHRWLLDHFYQALDRIEWLVPSERVDEFTTLWAVENTLDVPNVEAMLNAAPAGATEIEELRSVIRQQPTLFSLDIELWEIAKNRFVDYRRKILSQFNTRNASVNASTAFLSNGSGIWLLRGWYPPLVDSDGTREWWAGPSVTSEIHIKRSAGLDLLSFDIPVVVGIKADNIMLLAGDGTKVLPTTLQRNGPIVRATADLSGLEPSDTITALVPQVFSPLMISDKNPDPTRRSFATRAWSLESR